MHEVGGNVRGVARSEDPVLVLHPLLRAAGDDMDDLLHCRMPVEGVALTRGHAHAHAEQLLRLGEAGPGEPLVRPPRKRFDLHLACGHEAQRCFTIHKLSSGGPGRRFRQSGA